MTFTGEEVAIITGASSGIGAGTAIKLVEKGVRKLCLTGRNLERLMETKTKCIQQSMKTMAGDDILLVDGDLTSEEVCCNIVTKTMEKFSRIDILVNNAGIYVYEAFETCPVEKYDSIMNVNMRSIVILTQKCVPHLKVTKGNVVNVSSINGLRALHNCVYYCMSKAALDMFTKCIAVELAPSGIRVNCVNPGMVKTDIPYHSGFTEDWYEKLLERTKTTHPIGRHGEVEEVANLIVFLASKEASFMTGNIVSIDGGWAQNLCQ